MTLITLEVPVTICETKVYRTQVLLSQKEELKKHLEENADTNWFIKNATLVTPDSRPNFNINHIEEYKVVKEECLG